LDLYPAIDLRGGRVVQLVQGDFDRETVHGDDPVAVAQAFAAAGAPWIHMVDLDAARTGVAGNRAAIAAAVAAVAVPVQAGGGVRTDRDAAELAEAGVARVVMGTAALEDAALVARVAARQPVALGLDVRGREVATHGWTVGSGEDLFDVVARFADAGAAALVATHIHGEGLKAGPDVEGLGALLAATELPVIASGGVGTLEHVRALAALRRDGRRLEGVIVGTAIYDGAFTVADAVAATAGVR
jgi:phosphoribosylformimino-5-aminoimidazole carboxamide ribotide isomerase